MTPPEDSPFVDETTLAAASALSASAKWTLPVEGMTYSVLEIYHNRLGRLCKANKSWLRRKVDIAACLGGSSILLFGGALGGAIGLIPFWATDPSRRTKVEYIGILSAALLVGVFCLIGRVGMGGQRAESARAIYDDWGGMLEAYKAALEREEAKEKLEHEKAQAALKSLKASP